MHFVLGMRAVQSKLPEVKNSIKKYSPKFEQKIFTTTEIDYCQSQGDPAKHFAARFAVKEAVSKCLGTGITGVLGFKDMEVINEKTGKPVYNVALVDGELLLISTEDPCLIDSQK